VTRAAALAFVLGATALGCALGPNYKRPTTIMTPTFRGQDRVEAESFADVPWWRAFADEPLAALIKETLANSYDLQDAVARVLVARENAHISTDALMPSIGISGGPSYQQVFNPFSNPGVPGGNFRFASYAVTGSLSWEIDLWGRLRRLRQSALADFLAAEENRRGVIVSLIANVATTYFNLVALDLQLEITHNTVASRKETLVLFQQRETGGVGDRLDTASEEALLTAAEATIPDLERQIVTTENQLAILLGRAPGPIARAHGYFKRAVPPRPPAGLPAALLERRPDVRLAEAQLVSGNALVGAAYAALFPTLSFSGSAGLQSADLSSLFSSGAFTFGLNVVVNWLAPILNGAAYAHRYRAQQATVVALVADYRRTVLAALADTSTALVTIDKLREVRASLEASVKARVVSVELAKVRFRNGVASYLDVVQAEQNLFPAEIELAQTIGLQFVALAQLYRALGGGWQTEEARR
jgi:multidrug efflux system outer membrane protein